MTFHFLQARFLTNFTLCRVFWLLTFFDVALGYCPTTFWHLELKVFQADCSWRYDEK